jgi:hypothetical protein
MCFKNTGITGISISLAISLNKLISESSNTVLVTIFCGEFVSGCNVPAFTEYSNLLLHCNTDTYEQKEKRKKAYCTCAVA